MKVNSALLTTSAKVNLDQSIDNYGAGVFAHLNADWQAHTQSRLHSLPYKLNSIYPSAVTVNATIYSKYQDTGTDILLFVPYTSFGAVSVNFFSSNNGNWFPAGPNASFGASISGNLSASAGATYTFTLKSQDGSYLFVDGVLVVNNGGPHSPRTKTGTIFLSAGPHSFVVKYATNATGLSGVDLTLPPNVSYAATATGALMTVAQAALRLQLDFADYASGSAPATEIIKIPAILIGPAPSANAAPLIVTQPVSQTVAQRGTTLFSVSAISDLTLHYQWFFNGAAIDGATATVLTVSNAVFANAGDYYVTVSNSSATSTSDTVTLTVF